jgi:hypothetical protein
MKRLKNMVALATVLALVGSSVNYLNAQDEEDYYSYGYEDSRRIPSLAPAIALGTIAVVAIIAVAVQNNGHSHGHGHGHSN